MSASFPDAVVGTCDAVRAALADAPPVDLTSPTPCGDFDLRALVEHVVGTTTAMARLGAGQSLDPANPWGGGEHAADGDWAGRLRVNLDGIARGWGRPEAWEGEAQVGGSTMPRPMLGQMALIEVAMHGWDVARALGREVELDEEVADAVDRAVAETAELGRQMGAYGPEVTVPGDAPGLARALGKAGRDPGWTA